MSAVTLDELHARTTELIGGLPKERSLTIYDGGKPVAVLQSLLPVPHPPGYNPFLHRKLLPGVEELMNRPMRGTPIDQIIAEDRDRP